MPLFITEVSGATPQIQGAVCQVNTNNGVVVAGCCVGDGARPASNQKIELNGWNDNPPTIVRVWTTKGASNIAYRADESKPSYVVQQSAGPGGPITLWEGPVASADLALTVNEDGSLSMKTA